MEGSTILAHQSILILLSGPIASGKSTVAEALISNHEFNLLSSGDYLRNQLELEGQPLTRKGLQDLGDRLDTETNYEWLTEKVSLKAFENATKTRWVLDSARKKEQIKSHKALLDIYTLHVHITAPKETLRSRYLLRDRSSLADYEIAKSHTNEKSSENLIEVADLVLDTSKNTTDEICKHILDHARSAK